MSIASITWKKTNCRLLAVSCVYYDSQVLRSHFLATRKTVNGGSSHLMENCLVYLGHLFSWAKTIPIYTYTYIYTYILHIPIKREPIKPIYPKSPNTSGSNRLFWVPIPSAKNRISDGISFPGYTCILRAQHSVEPRKKPSDTFNEILVVCYFFGLWNNPPHKLARMSSRKTKQKQPCRC